MLYEREANQIGVRGDKVEGEEVVLNEVLLVSDDAGVKIGSPYVEGASVIGKVTRVDEGEATLEQPAAPVAVFDLLGRPLAAAGTTLKIGRACSRAWPRSSAA